MSVWILSLLPIVGVSYWFVYIVAYHRGWMAGFHRDSKND